MEVSWLCMMTNHCENRFSTRFYTNYQRFLMHRVPRISELLQVVANMAQVQVEVEQEHDK